MINPLRMWDGVWSLVYVFCITIYVAEGFTVENVSNSHINTPTKCLTVAPSGGSAMNDTVVYI